MAGRSQRIWSAVFAVLVVVGGLAVTGGPASANVTGTSLQLIKVAAPTDVRPAGVCSPDKVFTFDELQGVTLAAPVKVNYTDIGSYNSTYPQPASKIPAGTVIDSHFLDSNRDGCGPGATTTREGTWTFNQDILGVIIGRDQLNNSDYLGSPTTEYGGSYPSREFDGPGSPAASDLLQIVNARTIWVKVQTGSSTDNAVTAVTTAHHH